MNGRQSNARSIQDRMAASHLTVTRDSIGGHCATGCRTRLKSEQHAFLHSSSCVVMQAARRGSSARRRVFAASQLQTKPRVAVISDFIEERWPSMDLVAEMLSDHLAREHAKCFEVELVRPRFVWPSNHRGIANKQSLAAANLFNRFAIYPRWIVRNR